MCTVVGASNGTPLGVLLLVRVLVWIFDLAIVAAVRVVVLVLKFLCE